MKIYYLIPDIFRVQFSTINFLRSIKRGEGFKYLRSCLINNQKAIGGIKIFYQHIMCLRELGFDAHPLALGKFDGNIFYPEIKSKRDVTIDKEDIVVAAEFSPYDGLKFDAIRVMFVQSWVFVLSRKNLADTFKSYRNLRYDHVISCGDYIAKYVKTVHKEECHVIQNGIDEKVFYPDDTIREENRILYLPRKNAEDAALIRRFVEDRFPNVKFIAADGLSEKEIALEYRKADIFLATGYPEGLPLPPLEAIFSGCVVVGFAGRGGRELLKHNQTALVAEDGDTITAAEYLISVLEDKKLKETLRTNSQGIKEKYTFDAMKKRIEEFYSSLRYDNI